MSCLLMMWGMAKGTEIDASSRPVFASSRPSEVKKTSNYAYVRSSMFSLHRARLLLLLLLLLWIGSTEGAEGELVRMLSKKNTLSWNLYARTDWPAGGPCFAYYTQVSSPTVNPTGNVWGLFWPSSERMRTIARTVETIRMCRSVRFVRGRAYRVYNFVFGWLITCFRTVVIPTYYYNIVLPRAVRCLYSTYMLHDETIDKAGQKGTRDSTSSGTVTTFVSHTSADHQQDWLANIIPGYGAHPT